MAFDGGFAHASGADDFAVLGAVGVEFFDGGDGAGGGLPVGLHRTIGDGGDTVDALAGGAGV